MEAARRIASATQIAMQKRRIAAEQTPQAQTRLQAEAEEDPRHQTNRMMIAVGDI